MNCSMPVDPLYAKKCNFKLIPVSEPACFESATKRINCVPEKAEKKAARLVEMAIDNFKERRVSVKPITGLTVREAVAGFSTESIVEALGGALDPCWHWNFRGQSHRCPPDL